MDGETSSDIYRYGGRLFVIVLSRKVSLVLETYFDLQATYTLNKFRLEICARIVYLYNVVYQNTEQHAATLCYAQGSQRHTEPWPNEVQLWNVLQLLEISPGILIGPMIAFICVLRIDYECYFGKSTSLVNYIVYFLVKNIWRSEQSICP